MKNDLLILKNKKCGNSFDYAMSAAEEYKGFENSYIKGKREFLVLEQLKIDCKRLGDFNTSFRFFGEDGIKNKMAWAVLDGVIELRHCGYKEALFVLETIAVFFKFYDGYLEFKHIGDYEALYDYITNRIIEKKIWE